jgi:excisionase family DNA binding protein
VTVIPFEELARLISPKQAARYSGLSISQVRILVANKKIASIQIGARILIPRDALEQFITDITVKPCRDETQVHVSASSKSAGSTTSYGANAGEAASAQRALRNADLLKQPSRTSSMSGRATPAPATQQKFS